MGLLLRVLASGSVVLLAGLGCASRDPGFFAGDPRAASSQVGEIQLNIRLMLTYDANKDGAVSREEVDSGLKRQFESADSDRSGGLNLREVQAENGRRWQTAGTASSPLIDWNQDGVVSLPEFGGTATSVFAQLDRDRGGVLSGAELEAPRIRAIVRSAGPPRQVERAADGTSRAR
jgi:hypothetical protein